MTGYETNSRVGHFVKEWRKHRKMTQERLAEEANLTSGAISQLEAGIINYTQPTLEALANALGCRSADLLGTDPAIGHDSLARTDDEIREVLAHIDGLLPAKANVVLSFIRNLPDFLGEPPSQPADHDQRRATNPRRESAPLKRLPQRSTS